MTDKHTHTSDCDWHTDQYSWECTCGFIPRKKAMDDLIAQDADLIDAEPVAYRYGFDGYGWQYIDNGSGSDWTNRHPDGEPLYAHSPADRIEELDRHLTLSGKVSKALSERIEALEAENERLREALVVLRDLPIVENDNPNTLHLDGEPHTGQAVDYLFHVVRKIKLVARAALGEKQ